MRVKLSTGGGIACDVYERMTSQRAVILKVESRRGMRKRKSESHISKVTLGGGKNHLRDMFDRGQVWLWYARTTTTSI